MPSSRVCWEESPIPRKVLRGRSLGSKQNLRTLFRDSPVLITTFMEWWCFEIPSLPICLRRSPHKKIAFRKRFFVLKIIYCVGAAATAVFFIATFRGALWSVRRQPVQTSWRLPSIVAYCKLGYFRVQFVGL